MASVLVLPAAPASDPVDASPSAIAVAPPAAPFAGSFEYYACYTDSTSNRTLQDAFLFSSTDAEMTLEACAAFCEKYAYMGVE